MDARLIALVFLPGRLGGKRELRYANRRDETWPGYDESAALGKKGFWFGDHRTHRYIGPSKADAEWVLEANKDLGGEIRRV